MSEDKILDFCPNENESEETAEGPSTITLVDEDGNEVEMAVVTMIEHEENNYLILLPVENMQSGNMEVAILKVEYDPQTHEEIYVTGDTPDYEAVFNKFEAMLNEEIDNMDLSEIGIDTTPES